ncbi:hypothetical protein ACET3Z_025891 [Daucus carota]
MALNQIHYNSIRASRQNPETQFQSEVHNRPPKAEQWNIIRSFMESLAHFIEPSVLEDALSGDEKALSLALGQIHYHSLEETAHPDEVSHPFKDALLKNPVQHSTTTHPTASSDFVPSQKFQNRKQFNNTPITPVTIGNDQPETTLDANAIDEQEVNSQPHAVAKQDNGSNHFNGETVAELGKDVIVIEQSGEDETLGEKGSSPTNLEASTQSSVNPTTPRTTQDLDQSRKEYMIDSQSCHKDPDIFIHSSISNWKPRDDQHSSSNLCSIPENDIIHEATESSEEDDHSQDELSQDYIREMENLRVKSKRGRPRKFNPKLVNKHFKVPRRKKTRGEGLQQITHFFLNDSHDEADAIYETGMLMGLLPALTKEESLASIRSHLEG